MNEYNSSVINQNFLYKPIQKLPQEVARKIAAGEVIDRPAAVVRELIDNSIDSGASSISVEIINGGLDTIRISDNGFGMSYSDLNLCTKTHTTSKIKTESDLLSLSSLGFRGEALSSIDAVSKLEIKSTRDGKEAWHLALNKLNPTSLAKGTIVQVSQLFENFPARKQFLKRQASETSQCKQIFIEKALPWPTVEFRLSIDGNINYVLPQAESFLDRSLACLKPTEPASFFYTITNSGPFFSYTIVLGSPDVRKKDRRFQYIFINGRRIIDYSLLQAIAYGSEGFFPNGAQAFCLVFLTIDPSQIDINIHPAKKEVRFKDSTTIHHAISSSIKNFYHNYTVASITNNIPQTSSFTENSFLAHQQEVRQIQYPPTEHTFSQAHAEKSHYAAELVNHIFAQQDEPNPILTADFNYEDKKTNDDFIYFGQVLGTFLAVERNNTFYLIDQHAAHERILYNALYEQASLKQELLVPYTIETTNRAQDEFLQKQQKNLDEAGFRLNPEGEGIWQITAVPIRWQGSRKDLIEELLDLSFSGEKLVAKLYASSACKAACKDGSILDYQTACAIIRQTFLLKEPICPHGRPVWIAIGREELFKKIGRT